MHGFRSLGCSVLHYAQLCSRWKRAAARQFIIEGRAVALKQAPVSDAPQIRMIRHKRAAYIEPGAILFEDFCDQNGTILLTAGTILNERVLRQLRSVTTKDGDEPRLWVGKIDKTAGAE